MTTVDAFVALGSNLHSPWGPPDQAILCALARLALLPDSSLRSASRIHWTEPEGPVPQDRFANAAARLRTALTPRQLLRALLDVEADMGRDRSASTRWGPRVIDLDLLLYADLQIDEPGLTVPHPRMARRRFVLQPLAEIAPHVRIPGASATVAEALLALEPARTPR